MLFGNWTRQLFISTCRASAIALAGLVSKETTLAVPDKHAAVRGSAKVGSLIAATLSCIVALSVAEASAATLFTDIGSAAYSNGGYNITPNIGSSPFNTVFTASRSGDISQIDIALYYESGPYHGATVTIYTDNSNQIGTPIGSWSLSTLPTSTPSSLYDVIFQSVTGIAGTHLNNGQSYFLSIAAGAGSTILAVDNNMGISGYNTLFNGPISVPAFDILSGDTSINAAVPEPSTWAMMILGFCGIGFMTYRRSRTALGAV